MTVTHFHVYSTLKTAKRRKGFGKTGAWSAQLLSDAGAKVIGVSSAETAVYNEV